MARDEFNSIKIKAKQYRQLSELSAKTGTKFGFHLERAIEAYMKYEAPVWLEKVEEIERSVKRR